MAHQPLSFLPARLPMEGGGVNDMWELKDLIEHADKVHVYTSDDRWVPSRPVNYKYRSLKTKIKEAIMVFTGKADCFLWPKQ